MNKEELIQFLKENLQLYIYNSWHEDGIKVNYEISIGEEEIVKDYFVIDKHELIR